MSKSIESTLQFSFRTHLFRHTPICKWLPKYSRTIFTADLIAGITLGLTMMPQSIAYANLAGLPAQYGLYTAFIGSITYVFFGTIKEVSIGPTSLMAILTFSYTHDMGVDYVILLTFLAGLVELLMGVLRLGFLVDFISPCVTSGFTSAMAITVSVTQFKNLLGLHHINNHNVIETVYEIASHLPKIQIGDTMLSVLCLIFLQIFKYIGIKSREMSHKRIGRILWFISISRNFLIVLITAIVAFLMHKHNREIPFVLSGSVPSGMPKVSLPKFHDNSVTFVEMVHRLGTSIFVVPLGAVLSNVAIAKAFSSGKVVDATQEMITLGLCNILGSFVQAMPSSGAFTRSAVASSSGVRTPFQGVYSGGMIILALSFLTPYFYYIPKATLAAVLISAIISLFDYGIFLKLWKTNKFDFYLTLGTLIISIILSVDIGIIIGACANLIILLAPTCRPPIKIDLIDDEASGERQLFCTPLKDESDKNNTVNNEKKTVFSSIYYPAVDYMRTRIENAINSIKDPLSIMIDLKCVTNIDYSVCIMLDALHKTIITNDVKTSKICNKKRLCIVNANRNVWRTLAAGIPNFEDKFEKFPTTLEEGTKEDEESVHLLLNQTNV